MSTSVNSHRIRRTAVIGGFLDGAWFELADGLNCFIGARGTGKTTALEFVRYALDALPGRDDQPAERRRIESLVERNLAGGRVEVTIETKDGLTYIISRSAGEEPIVLTGDRQPTDLTIRTGGVFRADIYSQNEVECIADRTTSQLVLLDNFEAERIAEIESRLDHVRTALTTNANQVVPLQVRIATLTEELGTLVAVDERLKQFAAAGGQDAATINQAHGLKALRDRERRITAAASQSLQTLATDLAVLKGRLAQQRAPLHDQEVLQGPNAAIVQEVLKQIGQCGVDVDRLLQDARERLAAGLNQIATAGGRLMLDFTEDVAELEQPGEYKPKPR